MSGSNNSDNACPYCKEIIGSQEQVEVHDTICQAKLLWLKESKKKLREFRSGFLKKVEDKVKERMTTISSAKKEEEPIFCCVYCGESWGNKVELHDHHGTCCKKVVYEKMILEFKNIIQDETDQVHEENKMSVVDCVYCSKFTGSKEEVHAHEFICPKKPVYEGFILKWKKIMKGTAPIEEISNVVVMDNAITLEEVLEYTSDSTLDIKVLMRRFAKQYPETVKEIRKEEERKADEERRIQELKAEEERKADEERRIQEIRKADEERRIKEWEEEEERIKDRAKSCGETSVSLNCSPRRKGR